MFYENELQTTNQQEFRIEKVIKRRGGNYMSNGKVIIIQVVCNVGVLVHFGLGGIRTFCAQKIQIKFIKFFELYQVFMCNFLCQTVLIFPIYIYFTKEFTPFDMEVSVVYKVLAHSDPKIYNGFELYQF